jgi:hypothetical protein
MARLLIRHDDTPESPAEIEAWGEAEELLGDIERAFARLVAVDQGRPDFLPSLDESPEERERLKAAFELGALTFWDDIVLGRRLRRRPVTAGASAAAARKRTKRATDRDATLRSAAAEYRKRHKRASVRQMARDLARRLSTRLEKDIRPGTVRDRLRKLKP